MLDVYGVGLAVGPLGEVLGGVGFGEGLVDGACEEIVPFGVFVGEPAGRGVEDDLLLGVGLFAPDVDLREFGGVEAGARGEEHGPEDGAGSVYDVGGRAGDVDEAVPLAENVSGLMEALGIGGGVRAGVIDGVGEALGERVIDVGVDVGLELEHVGRGEVFGGGETLPDALVAVGVTPVEGDGEGIEFGGDAGVGGGEDAAGWVVDLGEQLEGDIASPLAIGVEAAGGDGTERRGKELARGLRGAADGDPAEGVIADVTLIVGVDHVLGGAAPGGEGGDEGGPVGGAVDFEEGCGEVDGVVDSPGESEGALVRGGSSARPLCADEEAGDNGGFEVAVLGAEEVEDDVFAAADVDGLGMVDDGLPRAVGGLELGLAVVNTGALDVDVLHVGAEVGEAPGDVVVVTDDDEGDAGQSDSGDMEGSAGGGGGFQDGLIPDAGYAVREMHVVREERLAGGGVSAGDGPVVRAGDAGFAEGLGVEDATEIDDGVDVSC